MPKKKTKNTNKTSSCLSEHLHNRPRATSHICVLMSPDLRFVVYAVLGYALEGSVEGFGYGLAEGGFACAWGMLVLFGLG